MNTERRQFSRVTFDSNAELAVDGRRLEAKVLDLSFKGALVSLSSVAAPALGASCQLTIRLTQLENSIGMTAEVAHIDGPLLGLQCKSIDLDSITHLRKLIELNLGDPALLERELKTLVSH